MASSTLSYKDWLGAKLTDPERASRYLNAALQDSQGMFLKGLRMVADSHRMATVAEHADVARESLYRMLSDSGNPTLNTLTGVLKSIGLKVEITPIIKVGVDGPPVDKGRKESRKASPASNVRYMAKRKREGATGAGVHHSVAALPVLRHAKPIPVMRQARAASSGRDSMNTAKAHKASRERI